MRRALGLTLTGLMILAAVGHDAVWAQAPKGGDAIQKTRGQVLKIGTGPKARVEVKLHDDTKLKGYISAADNDSFTITEAKTGAARDVAYGDVAQVKKSGGGLSTRTWIILAGSATAAAVVGFTVIKPVLCDGGAGC